MNEPFIPLIPHAKAQFTQGDDLVTIKVIRQRDASATIRSLTQVLSAQPSAALPPSAPAVTLKRDGDSVTHISVKCACGEVIELACAY